MRVLLSDRKLCSPEKVAMRAMSATVESKLSAWEM